jgi:hypothetical protein
VAAATATTATTGGILEARKRQKGGLRSALCHLARRRTLFFTYIPLTFGEIAAMLIVVMVAGLVLCGVLIIESYHGNFGACGARGSMCLAQTTYNRNPTPQN